MILRRYQSEDCREITELFYETVHKVNARDYRKEQLDVWATGQIDLAKWDESLREHYSIVAVEDEKIVGFGDIDSTGYLDRLYIHAEYQGKGFATAICDELEHTVSGKITTHASITARPFFEKRGYQVVKEQQVERQGILLTNFVMEKAHVELKRNLKIALLQIAPCGTLEENLEKGIRRTAMAARRCLTQ